MATDGGYNQALASFMLRKTVAIAMSMDEWIALPVDVRQRIFVMVGVSDRRIIDRFRNGIEDLIAGRKGQVEVEKELHMWLRDQGYRPPDGETGKFNDLSSLERINFELRTNALMASGHANWVRSQTAIRAFPCQRLVRMSNSEEPIDWETRWAQANMEIGYVPGIHPTEKVALLNHPIWTALSRFGLPYPPFDFGSGMGVRRVSRSEALEMGFDLKPNTDPMQQPIYRTMDEALKPSKTERPPG